MIYMEHDFCICELKRNQMEIMEENSEIRIGKQEVLKTKYKFRFIHGPEKMNTKIIAIDPQIKVEELKKILYAEYKFGPFQIDLKVNGIILDINSKLKDYKIDSMKDTIEILPTPSNLT